ncbi:MAG: lytic transglycosylase domain-containing protein, partial [Sphingobacteriaceae bacterium]
YRRLRSHRLHYQAKHMFPVMAPILAAYGIPQDFKYIPLVESGFKSGTSHKGASGAWQFMPHTARSYGLKVNSVVDERQQLAKSTVAACKYLRSLYKEFNSWTLVAAAYNIGENKLKRIIRQQDHANYFRLKLNHETAGYVYKLVAMKEIIENPTRYGYHRVEMPQQGTTIFTQEARYYPESFLRGVVLKHALVD